MSRKDDPGCVLWPVEKLWQGETVFLLGGGPSLRDFDCSRLRGRRVMAINQSCDLAPWADALFFTDHSWFLDNRDAVMAWPGLVFTVSRAAKREAPERLLRPPFVTAPDFAVPPGSARLGRSSGHSGIGLLQALGVARIVLLGFDMRLADGRSHHHDRYRHDDEALYREDMLPAFAGWREAAERVGLEILNATPGSALLEFEPADIDEVLCAASSPQ